MENIQRNLITLFEGNLKEISQFFEGNFDQNKEKKRIFWFFKVEALDWPFVNLLIVCAKTVPSPRDGEINSYLNAVARWFFNGIKQSKF